MYLLYISNPWIFYSVSFIGVLLVAYLLSIYRDRHLSGLCVPRSLARWRGIEEKLFFDRIAGSLVSSEAEYTAEEAGEGGEKKGRRRREANYGEFITLTKARRMASNTAAIREAFRTFDSSGEGYI